MFPSADANIAEVVQSHDHVVLLVEKFHDARIVPIDSRPRPPGTPRSWMGDSRGHWEGNTLVVDTTNFTDKIGLTGRFDGSLHLVERFTRSSPTTLLYEVRIDDPTAYVRPWSVTVPWVRTNEPLLEFACHEGNYSLPNILSAVRDAEQSNGTGQGR